MRLCTNGKARFRHSTENSEEPFAAKTLRRLKKRGIFTAKYAKYTNRGGSVFAYFAHFAVVRSAILLPQSFRITQSREDFLPRRPESTELWKGSSPILPQALRPVRPIVTRTILAYKREGSRENCGFLALFRRAAARDSLPAISWAAAGVEAKFDFPGKCHGSTFRNSLLGGPKGAIQESPGPSESASAVLGWRTKRGQSKETSVPLHLLLLGCNGAVSRGGSPLARRVLFAVSDF